MRFARRSSLFHACAFSLLLLPADESRAGIHTWDVNEVFSNGDGTIQFVELWEANGTPNEVGVGNGTVSSNTQTYAMSEGPVASPTTNKYFLVATQSFADLPGAPTPDAIIPAGMIPFFAMAGDTVSFVGFDSWAFGAVPTNGTDSLDRITGVGANTPTNYAGATGTVDASPATPTLPTVSFYPAVVLVLAILGGGLLVLMRRRRSKVWYDVDAP